MTQNSFPKAAVAEEGLDDHQWKNLMLPMGRGIIDKGGSPYRLTARDSVTNTVTIGVDTREGENFAILDGFLHHMDAPESITVPAVTTDTVFEIGLVYDPQAHAAEKGPVTLTAWAAPADTSQGKSYLVLYRMTRKNNLALGATPYEEERPRVAPVFSVSKESSLPKHSMVLVDSLGFVRTTGRMFRADISEAGTITWSEVSGADVGSVEALADTTAKRRSDGTLRAKTPTNQGAQFHADTLVNIGWINSFIPDADTNATPNTAIKRFGNGAGGSVEDPGADMSIANKRYVDNKTWAGERITSGFVPRARIGGSELAWSRTSGGATWATVAVNPEGAFFRYPSALKYKKNLRPWKIDPLVALGIEPVKYEDKENGDTRIGVVADSYVQTIPELVQIDPATNEVEGWNYTLWPTLQQVAIRYLHEQNKAQSAEIERLKFNQAEILALLGLNTDATGRVITTPDTANGA